MYFISIYFLNKSANNIILKMKDYCINILKKYTGHSIVKLVSRGNSAIFLSLLSAKKSNPKKYIIIPEEGGWISYWRYPQLMDFEIKEVKTKDGVIDLKDLEKKSKSASAFLYNSMGSYAFEQPVKEIFKICHNNKCLVINDVSMTFADKELANGEFADMELASFGEWKLADFGEGGMISFKNRESYESIKDAFSMFNDLSNFNGLFLKLEEAKEKLELQYKLNKSIKKELKKVIHKELKGVNVITEKSKDTIDYAIKRGIEVLSCPMDIKLKREAYSLEIKRLGIKQLRNMVK